MLNVAAAIIEKNGKYLIAKRKAGSYRQGMWEFPGGKIEPGETPEACLERELMEELGIVTNVGEFIMENTYDYGDRVVRLLAYRVFYVSGEFQLNAHDELRWVEANEFSQFDFVEADLPFVQRLISINSA
ncbi:MAG: (deoxy)nucleoside triphosphate pyrophosphohydrolase [bacterium]|nr:(deoxy)nucleoside triphosphate pyrophosphohydrolase [bacterium]